MFFLFQPYEHPIALSSFRHKCSASKQVDQDVEKFSDPEPEVHFSWKIEPFVILWNGVVNGEYYESPIFTTEEGYTFRAKVYLKGFDAASKDHVSIEVEQARLSAIIF